MISRNQTNDETASCGKVEQPAGGGGGGSALAKALASSRQWSASTESRIVRVSRVFGGKDRHSKVRTIKGLRDRRVRLSVPTAIQLYDLQDRLGLSQPSKVVDWLLNAAQHEIDKLPPLQFPPQDLVGHHHHLPNMPPPFSSAAAASMLIDVVDKGAHCDSDLKGFMTLNNSLVGHQLVDGGAAAMPSFAQASYQHYAADPWSNGGAHEATSHHRASPHHSPFPSLLSLAPMSQLVFYSSEAAYGAVKEAAAADHFPVDNLDDPQRHLSLTSARSFLHSGSHE